MGDDGRLDIVEVNRRASLEIWQNGTTGTGNWLAVDLRGPAGNSRAVGAWIELRLDGRIIAHEVTVGGGHVSGQAGPQHFGLGMSTGAEVRVIWRGGKVSDWQAVKANQQVTLRAE